MYLQISDNLNKKKMRFSTFELRFKLLQHSSNPQLYVSLVQKEVQRDKCEDCVCGKSRTICKTSLHRLWKGSMHEVARRIIKIKKKTNWGEERIHFLPPSPCSVIQRSEHKSFCLPPGRGVQPVTSMRKVASRGANTSLWNNAKDRKPGKKRLSGKWDVGFKVKKKKKERKHNDKHLTYYLAIYMTVI